MQNKNYLVYILMLVVILGITGSCDAQVNSKSKSGSETRETRDVSTFSALDLSISANVYLKQGSSQSVELRGSSDDLEKVITEVSGSELKIKTRPGSWNLSRIDVFITMQDIDQLKIAGSGSIKNETAIKTNNLELIISGSGNINITDLSAQEISSVISGSGNISYSGSSTVNSSKIIITGSGNVNAEGIVSKDLQVNVTGSGNCKVNASSSLNIQVTGSGDVYYKGDAVVDAHVTGSGKVRQI